MFDAKGVVDFSILLEAGGALALATTEEKRAEWVGRYGGQVLAQVFLLTKTLRTTSASLHHSLAATQSAVGGLTAGIRELKVQDPPSAEARSAALGAMLQGGLESCVRQAVAHSFLELPDATAAERRAFAMDYVREAFPTAFAASPEAPKVEDEISKIVN